MIGKQEEIEVSNYLKKHKINRYEVYEELHDHLLTSYENVLTNAPQTDIKMHIKQEVQSSFGGVSAMKKFVCQKRNLAHVVYRKKLLSYFTSFFNGPMLILSTSLLVLIYVSLTSLDQVKVYALAMTLAVVAVLFPLIIAFYGYLSFRINCQKQGKAYSSSIKNQMIINLSLLLTSFFHLFNTLNIVFNLDEVTIPQWSLLLISIFTALYLLLSFSYVRLVRNEFEFKPFTR